MKNMGSLKTNIIFKLGAIFVLIIILLIPVGLVKDLIRERENIQNNAIEEISDKWGGGQTITGPYISIPYDKYVRQFSRKDSTSKIVKLRDYINILPENLNINGTIAPEKRYRGIYEVVVYESKLKISGDFQNFNLKQFDINPNYIHLDKAVLNIGITDLKGIEKQINLKWNKESIPFNSGVNTEDLVYTGVNARVSIDLEKSDKYEFETEIDLKGSQYIYFVPVGKTTDVKLSSDWKTPSFTGAYLPDERTVDEKGFVSDWNVLHLNRNYPQAWISNRYQIGESSFGTDLLLPVDNYKKSNRVAKYAILFVVLTFLVFFFVEVLNKVFIHPIQYLLVGIALVVFYSLLLAFSEHMLFNLSYILSSILTLSLVTAYTSAILKSKKVALMIFGILLTLYLFIFTIIQLEDYALLIGSVGVFVILSIVMYFSRKIDWYQIKLGEEIDL